MTLSFCGTREYLAPEILKCRGHTKMVDFWSFGCLIYEMLFGKSPFLHNMNSYNDKLLDINICNGNFKFTNDVNISSDCKDLIKNLLKVNPKERLGYNGIDEIKEHPFFQNYDWKLCLNKKWVPPIIPETEIKTEKINNYIPVRSMNSSNQEIKIQSFTYNQDNNLKRRESEIYS